MSLTSEHLDNQRATLHISAKEQNIKTYSDVIQYLEVFENTLGTRTLFTTSEFVDFSSKLDGLINTHMHTMRDLVHWTDLVTPHIGKQHASVMQDLQKIQDKAVLNAQVTSIYVSSYSKAVDMATRRAKLDQTDSLSVNTITSEIKLWLMRTISNMRSVARDLLYRCEHMHQIIDLYLTSTLVESLTNDQHHVM